MITKKVHPFDTFNILYKILTWLGFAKLMYEPKYKFQKYLHQFYRVFAFIEVIIYNLQHIFFVIQVFEDKDKFFESLLMSMPHFNLIMKTLTVAFGFTKLEKIRALINDPIFAANSKADEDYLRKSHKDFCRLLIVTNVGITISFCSWTTLPILERLHFKDFTISSYVPFKVDSDLKFALTLFLEHGAVLWTGYGHISLDLLIACYYYQAAIQLRMIRNNLAHMFDGDEETRKNLAHAKKSYFDEVCTKFDEIFKNNVDRYGKIIWYVNEVTSVFNIAVSIQFFSASFSVCLVIYKMSTVNPTYVLQLVFLLVLCVVFQFQVFLYCYCGELVTYESKFVIDALYQSEWLSLSPRFRRQLLIAMSRWIIPITPQVSHIIPLSLATFLSVMRAALNLFTVLKTTN